MLIKQANIPVIHVRLIAKIEQRTVFEQEAKRFKLKSLIMAQIERWRQA